MSTNNDRTQNEGILEVAIPQIRFGMTPNYKFNFDKVKSIGSSIPIYQAHSLLKCPKDDQWFILLVNWDSREDAKEGFRKLGQYKEWKELPNHFYDPFPTVDHYTCLT